MDFVLNARSERKKMAFVKRDVEGNENWYTARVYQVLNDGVN